jgi:hypothetical protein
VSEGLHSVAARVRCVCFGMAVLVGSLWATALAAEPEVDVTKAAKVKAAYLRYIAEFTTWPPEVLGNDEEPIVLGTMGTDPHGVAEILERAIERKGLLAQSRPLVLRRLPDPRDAVFEAALADCHLLFMTPGSDDDAAEWGRLRTLLADRPIVTVGEISGFSQAAGMIEFVIEPADSRVTMHIDLEAVQRANLRLSSRLLGLKQGVKIVRTPLATGACASASCVDRLRNARIDPGVLGSLDQERHTRLAPGPDR